jgi:hypothetical protein
LEKLNHSYDGVPWGIDGYRAPNNNAKLLKSKGVLISTSKFASSLELHLKEKKDLPAPSKYI